MINRVKFDPGTYDLLGELGIKFQIVVFNKYNKRYVINRNTIKRRQNGKISLTGKMYDDWWKEYRIIATVFENGDVIYNAPHISCSVEMYTKNEGTAYIEWEISVRKGSVE